MYSILCIILIDKFILRCSQTCRELPHYHCPQCQETVLRKCDLIKHLRRHESSSPVKKVTWDMSKTSKTSRCDICGEEMIASNISRHKRNQHALQQGTSIIYCNSCVNLQIIMSVGINSFFNLELAIT